MISNSNNEQLLTISQFAEKNQSLGRWPETESNLRSIYRRRSFHKLEKAFIKIGGRILVDEKQFYDRLPTLS